jgi:hypothetical protein
MSNRRSIAMAANHQAMSTQIRTYGVSRRDARLSNLEAKLEQLAMDARRIPQTSIKIRLTHTRCQVSTSLRGVLRSFLAVRARSWRSRCLTRSFPA